MTVYLKKNTSEWNFSQTQTPAVFPEPHHVEATPETFETQDESGKGKTKISYAKTTWLRVDEPTRKTLHSYGAQTIASWAGKNLHGLILGRQKCITVRDARIINSKAKNQLIPINAENVTDFTIDQIIRDRLKPITATRIKPLLKELGVAGRDFFNLKQKNGTDTIKKEVADKYNSCFRQHNLATNIPNALVFDLERIFNLANNEPIVEKTRHVSKQAFTKIGPEHRKKFEALSSICRQQLREIIGDKLKYIIRAQMISIKDAVLFHKISQTEIFDLTEKSVYKFAVHTDQVAELENYYQLGKKINQEIRPKIFNIRRGRTKTVTSEEAKQLNSYLVNNPFDFESILASAVQETEEEVNGLPDLPTPSNRIKRPLDDSTAPQGAPAASPSKRQCTAAAREQRAIPVVDGFHLNYLIPPLAYRGSFSLPTPAEAPPVQVITAPIGCPLDSQNSSPPALLYEELNDLIDFGNDEGFSLIPHSPSNLLSFATSNWED